MTYWQFSLGLTFLAAVSVSEYYRERKGLRGCSRRNNARINAYIKVFDDAHHSCE